MVTNTWGGAELRATRTTTDVVPQPIIEIVQDDNSCWMIDVTVVGQDTVGGATIRRSVITSTRVGGAGPARSVSELIPLVAGVVGTDIIYGDDTVDTLWVSVTGPAGNMNWHAVVHSIVKVNKP